MANTSADSLIEQLRATVASELLGSLRPLVSQLVEMATQLEAALSGGSSAAKPGRRGRRPGRPAKNAGAAPVVAKRSPGRPKGSGAGAAKRGPAAGSRTRATNPRGALRDVIREALGGSREGMKLADLRRNIMQNKMFKGRNPVALYNQIAGAIKLMPEVSKGANKIYTMDSSKVGSGSPKPAGRRGRPRKNAAPAGSGE